MPGFFIKDSGTPGLSPSNTAEFHRKHRWYIQDLGIPSVGVGTTRERGSGPRGTSEKALFAQSLQLPSLEFDEEVIESPSLTYKVAKRAKWKNCVVTFYDVHGLYEELDRWQKKIWHPQKGLQPASKYKGNPVFVLVDGEGKPKQTYTLMGAYPLFIDHGELSYTNSEIKLLSVTYSYDYASVTFV